MNNNPTSPRNNNVIVSIICNIYFLLFCFLYLYFLQSEVFRSVHFIKSGKDAVYYPIWGAVILTLILWLVHFILNYITRFKGKWQAVSLFPAFALLALLTNVDFIHQNEELTLVYNWEWWQVFLATAIYVLTAVIYRKIEKGTNEKNGSLPVILIPNFVILTILASLTGSIGNTTDTLYHELQVAQAIREKNPQKVFLIGKKSPAKSHSLTTLRNFAMAQTDSLGDTMFYFPQTDGANGLFFEKEALYASGFSNQDIYLFLGGSPKKETETVVHYLKRLCESDEGNNNALDYYLSALLLERQLSAFSKSLSQFYDMRENNTLPKHYQEALLLHQIKEGVQPDTLLISSEVRNKYADFVSLQNKYKKNIIKRNLTHRKFKNTYWWYYWYGE